MWNIPLAEEILFYKFIALSKDIEGLSGGMSKESNDGSSSSIENGSIIEDNLCPHEYTSDLMDVISDFVIIYEIAFDAFQYKFLV